MASREDQAVSGLQLPELKLGVGPGRPVSWVRQTDTFRVWFRPACRHATKAAKPVLKKKVSVSLPTPKTLNEAKMCAGPDMPVSSSSASASAVAAGSSEASGGGVSDVRL